MIQRQKVRAMKLFQDIFRKDMTASSVHTPTAIGNEDPKKRKSFPAMLDEIKAAAVAKRALQPNTHGSTAKSPFPYDPNALATLRPDQVPRFFGALTDKAKLPVKTVQLKDLHSMQDRVDPAKVKAIGEHGTGGNLAVVVRHDGREYIADGHHRLAADWLAGKTEAEVHHKDLEPVSNVLKTAPVVEQIYFKIAKIDEGLGLVFGWAIVCKVNGEDYYDLNIDLDGPRKGERVPEHIPEDVMTKAAAEFMQSARAGNEMHEGPDSGSYVFAFPLTTDIAKAMGIQTEKTGLMVAYKPTPEVLAKFRDRTYTGFSIEGSRGPFEEH